jgi:hypothetical protein
MRGRQRTAGCSPTPGNWASKWRSPAAAQPVSPVPFSRQIIALDEETEQSFRPSMVCDSILKLGIELTRESVPVLRRNLALDE